MAKLLVGVHHHVVGDPLVIPLVGGHQGLGDFLHLDKEGGVDIDCCEAVSRPLSDALDEADPIQGSYT